VAQSPLISGMKGDDQQYTEMLSLRSRSKRLVDAVQDTLPADVYDHLPPDVIQNLPADTGPRLPTRDAPRLGKDTVERLPMD